MEKINIAELLKNCPKGMELDCIMFVNPVKLDNVVDDDEFPITIETTKGCFLTLTEYGTYAEIKEAKCVIFPKGKTTWEGFVPPCKFKDGDVISDSFSSCIFKGEGRIKGTVDYYCGILAQYFHVKDSKQNHNAHYGDIVNYRLATEEEKAKLFQAIKDNGYKWNSETKTLEKLIEPKFKVGDRIRQKGETSTYTITDVNNAHYFCGKYVICDTCDNNWELVPNNFDINTLVSFESRVLVRSTDDDIWRPAIYGFTDSDRYCVVGGIYWKQCIPYEGNEHLRGKTNDCADFYKTWD